MTRRILVWAAGILAAAAAALFMAWISSEDPRTNQASFEDAPLQMGLSPLTEAITLAQFRNDRGETVTLLVTQSADGIVTGIDFADIGAARIDDPFEVLASVEPSKIVSAEREVSGRIEIPIEDLLPSGPAGSLHIGIGTNFPEHAEEASSDSVFHFPKFGTATPARTHVVAPASGLLDYEVEFCMRFDRPIASLKDFDDAVKGLFLCADFTDRIALLELADFDNLDSGYGFSDAKSGDDFFPTGPFLVVPQDWRSFIAEERMTTELNGEARQDARGEEMTLDYRALADKALKDMSEARFFYKGEFYRLSQTGRIEPEMTLMSGTSEGVIFTSPARHDYIEMMISYVLAGGPFSGKSLIDIGVPVFIENELQGGHFLKRGDVVIYRSSRMGEIVVEVIAPSGAD
jgi:2-keto-4-pentenoate hydratase/2-oxohepta-3-ene-1,7-dioic acid hydratase in catechol pathway